MWAAGAATPRRLPLPAGRLMMLLVVLLMTGVQHADGELTFQYHDFSQVQAYLKDVNRRYPNITHLYSIGRSVQRRPLWVLAVSQFPEDHVFLRPDVKYVANMHGNEPVGQELLLHLIEFLVTSFGKDPEVTSLLTQTRIHILVTMNPDGFERVKKYPGYCQISFGRSNARYVDLNRDFPDYFSLKEHRKYLRRQAETRAIMWWLSAYQFVLSANFHGGALGINYPYDTYANGGAGPQDQPRYSRSPDDDVFINISRTYANTHPIMTSETCIYSINNFINGITNGANWYPFKGGMQDYNYVYAGCMEVSIEVSCCKYPPESELLPHWINNKSALLKYLQQVHMGVKGVVESGYGQEMKGAKVTVRGRERHWVLTTAHGEYWRLLLPGNYTILITAQGYLPVEIPVTVSASWPTIIYTVMKRITQP